MDPKATTHGVISSMTWNFLLVLYLKAFSVSSSLQLGLSKDSSTTKQVIDASTYYTKGTKVQVKRQ